LSDGLTIGGVKVGTMDGVKGTGGTGTSPSEGVNQV
jgi:hypothetical protein